MGLDGIKDLKELNKILQLTLDRVNAGDQTPLEVKYASRKFKLEGISESVKMTDIITKFKELADQTGSDKDLIGDIHDRIVLLDLQGDIALKNKGVLSIFFRNVLNPRFLTSHLDDVDAIQQEHVFDNSVINKATLIKMRYLIKSHKKDESKSKDERLLDVQKIVEEADSLNKVELTKNALRYLALTDPQRAYTIIKDMHIYLENLNPKNGYPISFAQSLKDLIRNLDIELSARPEHRDAMVENGEKTKTMIHMRIIRQLYENDPENFREKFLDSKFLPKINKDEVLKKIAERYPNAARLIMHALEKPEPVDEFEKILARVEGDDLGKLRTKLLNDIERKAAQEPNRTVTVKDHSSLAEAIKNLISFDKEPSYEITLNRYNMPEIIFSGTHEELKEIKKQLIEKYNYLPPPNLAMKSSNGKLILNNELLTYLLAPQNQRDQMNVLLYENLWIKATTPENKQQIILGAISNLGDDELISFFKLIKITQTDLTELSDKKINLLKELEEKGGFLKKTLVWKQLAVIKLKASEKDFNLFINNIREVINTKELETSNESFSIIFDPSYKKPKINFLKPALLGNSEFATTFKVLDHESATELLIPALYANSDQMHKMMYLKALKQNDGNKYEIIEAAIENLNDKELKNFYKDLGMEITALPQYLQKKLHDRKAEQDQDLSMWDILINAQKKMYLEALKQNNGDKDKIIEAAIKNLKPDEVLIGFFKESDIEISSLKKTLQEQLENRKNSKGMSMWDILNTQKKV